MIREVFPEAALPRREGFSPGESGIFFRRFSRFVLMLLRHADLRKRSHPFAVYCGSA